MSSNLSNASSVCNSTNLDGAQYTDSVTSNTTASLCGFNLPPFPPIVGSTARCCVGTTTVLNACFHYCEVNTTETQFHGCIQQNLDTTDNIATVCSNKVQSGKTNGGGRLGGSWVVLGLMALSAAGLVYS